MRHQVSPGCVLSQRCGPAASATINEEICVIGPRGNTVLMGGMEECHHGNRIDKLQFRVEDLFCLPASMDQQLIAPLLQTPVLPLQVSFAVIWLLLELLSPHLLLNCAAVSHLKVSKQPACDNQLLDELIKGSCVFLSAAHESGFLGEI